MSRSKRTRVISYVLFVICIFMQVAMAYPHHHHAESLCVSADMQQHHDDDADNHSCTSDCVTKFQCGTPHQAPHLIPIYSFYTLVYEPRIPDAAVSGFFLPEAVFTEKLHARTVGQTANRRAPPVSC